MRNLFTSAAALVLSASTLFAQENPQQLNDAFIKLLRDINTISVIQADRNDNWWELPFVEYDNPTLEEALVNLGQYEAFREGCNFDGEPNPDQLAWATVWLDWEDTLTEQAALFTDEEKRTILNDDRDLVLEQARLATKGWVIPQGPGYTLLLDKLLQLRQARLNVYQQTIAGCQ